MFGVVDTPFFLLGKLLVRVHASLHGYTRSSQKPGQLRLVSHFLFSLNNSSMLNSFFVLFRRLLFVNDFEPI